jgi:hypothetical protein
MSQIPNPSNDQKCMELKFPSIDLHDVFTHSTSNYQYCSVYLKCGD